MEVEIGSLENAGYQHLLLFPHNVSKVAFGLMKTWDRMKKG